MAVAQAVLQCLLGDSTLRSKYATYNFGNTTPDPAIFTTDPIPEDAGSPCAVITEEGGNSSFGTRERRGAEVEIQIRIFGDKDREHDTIRDVAWSTWRRIHRARLSIDGFAELGCIAEVPRQSRDDDGYPEFSIDVRVRILEELQ